jgi:hypothetical protein
MTPTQVDTLRYLLSQNKKIKVSEIPTSIRGNGFNSNLAYLKHLMPLEKMDYIKRQGEYLWVKDYNKVKTILAQLHAPASINALTNKVLLFITAPENEGKMYSERELSELLEIDINHFKAIGSRLISKGLITYVMKDVGYNSYNVENAAYDLAADGGFKEQTSTVADNNDFSHRVYAIPSKKNNTNNKISWYNKPIVKYLFWPLIVGLIVLAVAIILNQRYGLSA